MGNQKMKQLYVLLLTFALANVYAQQCSTENIVKERFKIFGNNVLRLAAGLDIVWLPKDESKSPVCPSKDMCHNYTMCSRIGLNSVHDYAAILTGYRLLPKSFYSERVNYILDAKLFEEHCTEKTYTESGQKVDMAPPYACIMASNVLKCAYVGVLWENYFWYVLPIGLFLGFLFFSGLAIWINALRGREDL
jgi:hypothetical protein